jgi:hypothetical protein
MTVTTHNDERLTADEREELVSLKNAISYYPHAVSAQKMELFTELFVRSIKNKSDCVYN